jgi:hypothetical protein
MACNRETFTFFSVYVTYMYWDRKDKESKVQKTADFWNVTLHTLVKYLQQEILLL